MKKYMSYNYEINHDNIKRKTENSRYVYKSNELDSQTFIFELILKNKNHDNIIVRKIMKTNTGSLINSDDNINYMDFTKYQLTIIDINTPDKYILVKDNIDHKLTTNTFINDAIYLEIFYDMNYHMILNYNIL
jgi:hypothetical protein